MPKSKPSISLEQLNRSNGSVWGWICVLLFGGALMVVSSVWDTQNQEKFRQLAEEIEDRGGKVFGQTRFKEAHWGDDRVIIYIENNGSIEVTQTATEDCKRVADNWPDWKDVQISSSMTTDDGLIEDLGNFWCKDLVS